MRITASSQGASSQRAGRAIRPLLLWSFLCLTGLGSPGGANQKSAPQPETGASFAGLAHEMTAPDLGAFLDGIVESQLERDDVAGAVVVVVKDAQVLFAKGYGYADVEGKKPASAENTLFRQGSISKLFTATAVMQLEEQGKLDLDRDVTEYLDFKIPATFALPITLRHLMTHTAGFEERFKDLFVNEAGDLKLRPVFLAESLPRRIFAPGTVPAYSNYGVALAGYIVERVSGLRFEDYIEENILKPLGMSHSTFRQPFPDSLSTLMSRGYLLASGEAKGFEIIQGVPAGALSSSGTDMARFMMAHLQDGQLGGARILRPETAQLMHARQFAAHPALNAMAFGFYEESRNGRRIIGHSGDTMFFHSDLHLIPDANVGFFVATNSTGAGIVDQGSYGPLFITGLFDQFLNRYFPYEPAAVTTPDSAMADAVAVSGAYMPSRRNESSILRLSALMGELTVSSKAGGTIEIDPMTESGGQLKRWREVEPLVYRNVNGQDRVAFTRDAAGRLEIVTDLPPLAYQRVQWYRDKRFFLTLVGFTTIVFLLALVLWPVGALVRRHYAQTITLSLKERRIRILTRIAVAGALVVMLTWSAILLYAFEDFAVMSSRLDLRLHLLQLVTAMTTLGLPLALYRGWRSWLNGGRSLWSRLGETTIALAWLSYVWLTLDLKLLSFHLSY
jgi:CubicO group peptidase (beta-lactamase class C family)